MFSYFLFFFNATDLLNKNKNKNIFVFVYVFFLFLKFFLFFLRKLFIMKCLFLIIYVVCLGSGVFASPKIDRVEFYSGLLKNQVTVGQFLSLSVTPGFVVYTGFESYLQSFEGTYFSPSMIDYMLGIKLENFGWEHACLHVLDKNREKNLPIRDRFYMEW